MRYIAHIRESDLENQWVEEHLLGVQKLAEIYGDKLKIRHITGLAGMLHDMGKFTTAFLEYIVQAVHHPETSQKTKKIDHSTAGGRLLYHFFHTGKIEREIGILAEIVGNAIISHHSYIHDYLDPDLESPYLYRVRDKKEVIDFDKSVQLFFESVMSENEFQQYVNQAVIELKQFLEIPSTFTREKKCMFLTKFVFSALIDADRTDARRFEEEITDEDEKAPCTKKLFQNYYDKLMAEINHLAKTGRGSRTAINQLRLEMSEQCDQFARRSTGIYTLSIPTGGGKTLASLRYALKHALNSEKKRIIYVLPYTTIIEQNAAEIRRILEDDAHILEHHSNVIEDDQEDETEEGTKNVRQKLKLAKDNWDSPIIFTTMVQFLNVIYAKGSRNIRRMHNLCEAVIIFDEVQKVPVSCVSLFNEALNFLKDYGQSSMVLCTATQPALDFVEHRLHITPDAEMIQNLDQVIALFKRVEIKDEATQKSYSNESLTDFVQVKLTEKRNMMVILNTKSVVKDLYERLQSTLDIPVYHLSTSMCASHRKEILKEIKDLLGRKERLVCVSTPLIEAGVDISFQCVIRSLSGLDSIAQAAGRCNRNGEDEIQQVYVIDHAQEDLKHLEEVRKGKEITKQMLTDLSLDSNAHGGHVMSVQAMRGYFQRFYLDVSTSLNFNVASLNVTMTDLLFAGYENNRYYQNYRDNKRQSPPLFLVNSYRTAAEHFHVIEDKTTSVIVPYGEGANIIAELNGAERIEDFSRLMRAAQQYMVNLFPYEIKKLDQNKGLDTCLDGQVRVLKDGAYNKKYGVDLENDSWTGGCFL